MILGPCRKDQCAICTVRISGQRGKPPTSNKGQFFFKSCVEYRAEIWEILMGQNGDSIVNSWRCGWYGGWVGGGGGLVGPLFCSCVEGRAGMGRPRRLVIIPPDNSFLKTRERRKNDACPIVSFPCCSLAVNVPKFFEAEVTWHDDISQLQVTCSNLFQNVLSSQHTLFVIRFICIYINLSFS